MNYSNKNQKAAENAIFYNIIAPDAAMLIIGLVTGFASILAVFS